MIEQYLVEQDEQHKQQQLHLADPSPASFENIPLFAPCKITAPIPPPIAELGLNASVTNH